MPDIFRRSVYEAVAKDDSVLLRKLRSKHFEEFSELNKALGWLTPQQRCDAIYGDWIEAINLPESGSQLRLRRMLIEQGGLAANYLAEFAQNADDALEEISRGKIQIWTAPGWLFVANNGRKINGTDLLGLCRFFNNGSKIEATTAELIGKFGIGFKSCYRIGEEVWVNTWKKNEEEFSFRIPLCAQDLPRSHYNPKILKRILDLLPRTNSRRSQDELGFCTPEFQLAWPKEITKELTRARSIGDQGSAFAIKLHPHGEEVLRDRIQGQRFQIYELCPLFLRRLRVIGLEDTTLTLKGHREDPKYDLPGAVHADRVTLETKDPSSNSRFWVLSAIGPKKPWKLALHADSKFSLSFKTETGESTSLRDGAAYAFFPLSIPWPFRLHLHLDLPTNLDRSNWSPSNADQDVSKQIDAAIAGLAKWLEAKHLHWRDDWSVGDLIVRVPSEARQDPDKPARWLYQALKREVGKRKLLRTIWGSFGSARDARCVLLREDGYFVEAWRKLGEVHPELSDSLSWCLEAESKIWGIEEIDPKEIIALAESWLSKVPSSSQREFSRNLFVAFIGLGKASTTEWKQIFDLVIMDDQGTTFAQLCALPGGATLTSEWHEVFAQLAHRTRHETWTETMVGDHSLYGIFKRFSNTGIP